MFVTCRVIGDYHIIDGNNGLYEVWFVNPHDEEDEFQSEHETLYSAEWNALCHHNADVALQQARTSR
jgi:hypothetical protein